MLKELFILEDNHDLLDDILDEATQHGWKVHKSRCVEEALQVAATCCDRVSAALIDLMIPDTEEALGRLDILLQDRARLVLEKTKYGKRVNLSASELLEARQCLLEIDARIQQCVNPEGGLAFLTKAKAEGLELRWKIAVFSARDKSKDGLEERVKAALGCDQFLCWLHKPVPQDELVGVLTELAPNGQ